MNYPDFIDPIAISIPISGFWGDSLNIYWYGIAYVLGAYLIYLHVLSTRHKFNINLSNDLTSDLIFTYGLFLGAVVGGRVGNVIFYDLHLQLDDPFYVFKIWQGGMSFHGGLIGVMFMMYLFSKKYGFKFFQITDWVAPSIPIALFFGRIANFINAELYGRATNVSWGMIFPSDPEGIVRHPSQLYEAALEGIALFIFLNLISKDQKSYGRHSAYFLIGYGLTRSLAEFFRVPDYVYGNDFLLFSFLTQGQLLCIPMIILGVLILIKNNARISRPT